MHRAIVGGGGGRGLVELRLWPQICDFPGVLETPRSVLCMGWLKQKTKKSRRRSCRFDRSPLPHLPGTPTARNQSSFTSRRTVGRCEPFPLLLKLSSTRLTVPYPPCFITGPLYIPAGDQRHFNSARLHCLGHAPAPPSLVPEGGQSCFNRKGRFHPPPPPGRK